MTQAAPEPPEKTHEEPGETRSAVPESLVIVVLGLITLHALLGFVTNWWSWKMFYRVQRYEYRLQDRHGQPVNVFDYLNATNVNVDPAVVYHVGRWLAKRQPERAPFRGKLRLGKAPDQMTYALIFHKSGKVDLCRSIDPDQTGGSSATSTASPPSSSSKSSKR